MTLTVLLWIVICVLALTQLLIIVPAYTGRLMLNILTQTLRPVSQGLRFVWPWEVSVEDSHTDIVTLTHDFALILEVGPKNQPVPLKFQFTTIPHIPFLIQFRRFKKEVRITAIIENLKSFLTGIQEEYQDRDDIMNKLHDNPGDTSFESVEKRVRKFIDTAVIANTNGKAMTMQEYYGVLMPVFLATDIEIPKELQDAIVKNEVIERQNKGRTKEMNNVHDRAKKLMETAKKNGQDMQFEDAVKLVLVQDGKIKEEKRIFGLDSGSRGPIIDLVKGVINYVSRNK